MYNYDVTALRAVLRSILQAQAAPGVLNWLEEERALNSSFVLVPRKTGKTLINVGQEQAGHLAAIIPGFAIAGWGMDQLSRALLLINVVAADQQKYFHSIENLFLTAEMNELVALYASLPLLAYPDIWVKRCAEGIRSNIGNVLEAIMYHNPYPAQNLAKDAWNQLVLKAFFTGKTIHKITGIDARANPELAYMLSDYARERWAAGRTVDPALWRLVGPFIDGRLFEDIKRVVEAGHLVDRRAAALAVARSNYPPAKVLLNKYPELVIEVENKRLTWENLAR
jgi:hypothetical protein